MQTFLEVFVSLFAALGFLSLMWILFGKLVAPDARNAPMISVVLGFDGGANLEHTIRSLKWMREAGVPDFSIVIADVALDEEGKQIALRLTEQENGVSYTPITELTAWMSSTLTTK
ncbi:MAG: hypothetical protein H6Q60_729 [Oscillospiraceae bacterium]|nr:hypothetical protein [Oscillospiraceae bacterium]